MSWRPTKGKKGFVDNVVNWGSLQGRTIYLHYTDYEGFINIITNNKLTDKRRNETRVGSKEGIYLCPSNHTFSPENAVTLLFFGNEFYKSRGDYVVVFGHTPLDVVDQPVTSGSRVRELIYQGGDIVIESGFIVYAGVNPFQDVFSDTEHPIQNWSSL
jgi:hypothetical protein